ncbi:MAG: hypothetical protein IJS95_02380 [Prevotella sp.]|nr:hypothetical protein [Prevotella sp.]
MKKNVTMWMAALALMVSACGGGAGEAGSAGSERPEAFDEMFDHMEAYYRVSAEQGRQAADAMDLEFWKEHRLGSLKFSVAIEDSLPLSDLELEFRGSNYNNGLSLWGTVKETGDDVPGTVYLVCYRDGQPVMVEPITLGKHNRHGDESIGYSYNINTSLEVKRDRNGIVEAQRHFDRILLQRKCPDLTLANLAANGVKVTDETVVFANGKLGPVTVGSAIGELPQQVKGLYDKMERKTVEHEDEMDGPWTEDYYLFTKDGKSVFRVNLDGGKVFSIRLLEGSSFIVTPGGFYVGMPALDLVNRVRMRWETYYDGEVFATKDHFTYYVSADYINGDIPTKIEDFKDGATITGIVYSVNQ